MSSPEPATAAANPAGPTDTASLVRLLREELIKTQLIVLDLNDRVLEKETEKADTIAILGQVELVLEQKLNRISELESEHRQQVSVLGAQLEQAGNDIRAKDAAIQNLSNQLQTANQEIANLRSNSDALTRALEQSRQDLAATNARLEQTAHNLSETQQSLAVAKRQLAIIFRSALWRLGRPWRALFGPKP